MAVGTSLLSLLGNKDPREALLQSIVQGSGAGQQPASGAPYAAQAAGGGGAAAPAAPTDPTRTGAVTASQPADALASPPDLAKMFQDIISYDSRARNIDRGFGLIGSAVSQDGNRGDTLRAFTGDAGVSGGVPSLGGMAELAIGMQQAQMKAKQRAAMMLALPGIAKRYNLSPEVAQYLYDTGELDSVITEAEKPRREIRELGDGTVGVFDLNDNSQIGTYGPKKTNFQIVDDPVRGKIRIDLNSGVESGVVAGVDPAKNREIVKSGTGENILVDKGAGTQVGTFGAPTPTTKIIAGPNGTQILVDEAATDPTKANLGQVSGPDTMTGDTREYDRYVLDQKARNLPAMSYQDWRMTKPPSSSVTVNNEGQKLESEFAKVRGKEQAEQIGKYNAAADNAMDMLDSFDVIEAGLNANPRTGSFGESELAVRRFASTVLGMGDDEAKEAIAGGEMIQKMSNRMALLMRNPESGMGMPGSVSDKDIQFLKESQIGLGTSPEGNRSALEIFRRLERRKIEYAEEAEKWADKHDSMTGFRTYARKYFKDRPLFEDLKQQLIEKQAPDERRTNELLEKYK